jgi:hypothetical protein
MDFHSVAVTMLGQYICQDMSTYTKSFLAVRSSHHSTLYSLGTASGSILLEIWAVESGDNLWLRLESDGKWLQPAYLFLPPQFCIAMPMCWTEMLEPKKWNGVNYKTKKNSVARVRERTTPTERPPLVDEVSANFCG